ncbi:class I SAM-dependent methyltransferase [Actinomadura madurae]|uniref:class I SAM-dependent methyltransferase n=1 Tax=Actinomadura madurae TaxID=1993 RepID=UPI0020D22596|nr:class I SAM-dependent methyltransferase [Actinomadura madurae]
MTTAYRAPPTQRPARRSGRGSTTASTSTGSRGGSRSQVSHWGWSTRPASASKSPSSTWGPGWSTLVDHLVQRGYRDLSAVDLSLTALRTVRDRLGPAGADVDLTVADVLDLHMGRAYALWHDRAVYHFLTEPEERADYLASLERSLRPGGWLVVATFGPDGPTTCSGLPIVRYTHAELAGQFPGYQLVDTAGEDHLTPWGTSQQFTAVLMRRL